MKTRMLGFVLLMSLGWAAVPAQGVQALKWPRVRTFPNGSKVTAYQPQVDKWDCYVRLDFRLAVEILEPGSAQPVPAALQMTGATNTDMSTRTVTLYDLKIVKANFPGTDDATTQRLTAFLNKVVPTAPMKLSVDAVLASVVPRQQQAAPAASVPPSQGAPAAPPPAQPAPAPPARTITVPPDPPVILSSQTPAILVIFDGEPKFAPIQGTGLLFAINTNWDVFQEEGKPATYLLNEDTWLQAPQPAGPWAPADKLPKSFWSLPDEPSWAEARKNLPGKALAKDKIPRVLVSVRPAELILLDGAPKFKSISGTRLSWATNTDSDLFRCEEDGKLYYLVSGRWFRAAGLDGPWAYVAGELPADFARIPKDHPKAAVRASVPGTPEAQEAVMLAQAPHEAVVQRNAVSVEVQYSGDPQFQAIEGTTVSYAVNTPNDVFRVENKYYCCYQAVWFAAPSPTGPWVVADTIPASIYSIPPSCPKYNVTYVTIYESTPTTVTTGYTSGYMGVFVAGAVVGACVVYGTGYYYPPYFYYPPHVWYPIYYPHPYTYGVAAFYNPYTGTFGRAAVAYGPYGGCGYAAAYNPATGAYARGAAVWGPYAGRGYAEAYNPSTGAWAQKAGFYGPGGQAGYAARGYNPSTGIGAATYQRSNPYASWGESVVTKGDDWVHTGHYSNDRGTIAGYETSDGGKGGRIVTDRGSTTIATDADNNKYAAHDGNVYKNDGDSWQKYEDGSWQTVEKPAVTDEQRAQAQAKAQSGQQQVQQKRGSAQSAGVPAAAAGTARPAASPTSSQSYSELEKDRQARTSSAERQKSYDSWKSGRNSAKSSSDSSGSSRKSRKR